MKIFFEKVKKKIQYKSEFILSKNPIIQIVLLAVVALIVAILATLVLELTQIMPAEWKHLSNSKILWGNIMRVIDQGTMVNDEGSWLFMLTMFLTTIIGLIIVSTLISIITEGYETKVEELRKGRSAVIEKNHIVILGWSSKIFKVVDEIIIGHELSLKKRRKLCITILADKNKTEMEDSIHDNCKNSLKARIVCRSGNPIVLEKLGKLSIPQARAILILAAEKPNPDTFVFKSILAVLQLCESGENVCLKSIIAELCNPLDIDLIINQVKLHEKKIHFLPLNSNRIIAEIIAQTSVQKGLSTVYNELLKFNKTDNEIYFIKASLFHSGKKGYNFKDLLNMFHGACLIGLLDKLNDRLLINPLTINEYSDYIIKSDDELVFIAKNKKNIKFRKKKNNFNNHNTSTLPDETSLPYTNTIIFGCNNKITNIIGELENYVRKDSGLIIVADITDEDIKGFRDREFIGDSQFRQNIEFKEMNRDIVDTDVLDSLKQERFDNIILLNSMESKLEESNYKKSVNDISIMEEMDAHTIKSLLNIREYFEKNEDKEGDGFSIVTEMKFTHNKEIVPKGDSDEFIISDEILSAIFAQTVLNKDRGRVYLETLFLSDGNEIYLKDASHYVELDKDITFSEIIFSAVRLKEIAIGYIKYDIKDDNIKINPPKNKTVKFTKNDKIIVLAEDFTFNICK